MRLSTSTNSRRGSPWQDYSKFKICCQKAGVKTAGSANVQTWAFLCRWRVAWGTRLGGEGMYARGDEQPVFTARPVWFCHHRCWKSALPPDVPLPERLTCCRLPGCALPLATLQSRHSSLRSAPGKWRFGFLSLLSRHIYCSWFTGLRREYSNNCSKVNRYPGTHVQGYTLRINTLVHVLELLVLWRVFQETPGKTGKNRRKRKVAGGVKCPRQPVSQSGTGCYLRNLPAAANGIKVRQREHSFHKMPHGPNENCRFHLRHIV